MDVLPLQRSFFVSEVDDHLLVEMSFDGFSSLVGRQEGVTIFQDIGMLLVGLDG